jgi:uncharacterized protein DUF6527
MKLLELNPILKRRRLELDCPECGKSHRLVIGLGPDKWKMTGESIPTATIRPSYKSLLCAAHFTITAGEIEPA